MATAAGGWMACIIALSVLASVAVFIHLNGPGQEAGWHGTATHLLAEVQAQGRTIQQLRRESRTLKQQLKRAKSLPAGKRAAEGGVLNRFDLQPTAVPGVGIVVVVDEHFEVMFFRQLAALRCYAKLHGYGLMVLTPSETCGDHSIFFHKHCRVAEVLEGMPQGFAAFVMDADVVPVVMERGLDEWLEGGEDLVFYEREWSNEMAAGNYIARHTPFTIDFLRAWANYSQKAPKTGFSSDDNGAIHVLLNEVLHVPCAGYVRQLYNNLTNDGMDKLGVPLPYKRFIAAAHMARGPPRQWINVHLESSWGNITVLPRMHGWVMDGDGSFNKANAEIGSVFHHRVKTSADMDRYYDPYEGVQECKVRENAFVDQETYLSNVNTYITAMAVQYGLWSLPSGDPVPFFLAITQCCAEKLQCRPLRPREVLHIGAQAFPDPWAVVNASGGLARACGAEPGIYRALPVPPPACGDGDSSTGHGGVPAAS